jgi:HAD superfamily hydrolase (TIGR01509 family)
MQTLKKNLNKILLSGKATKNMKIFSGNFYNIYKKRMINNKSFADQQTVGLENKEQIQGSDSAKSGNNVKWGSVFKENDCFDYKIKNISKTENPYKYKNYIFDINDVLLKFNTEMIKDCLSELRSILKHPIWKKYLDNSMKKNDVLEIIGKDIKLSVEEIIKILDRALHCLSPIEENIKFLNELKEKGMKLICISNCPIDDIIRIRRRFSFFDNFDVIFSSGDLGVLKPDTKAFKSILEFYDLNAEECVFFDDSEQNIKFAEDLGIKGVVNKDIQSLEEIRKLSEIKNQDDSNKKLEEKELLQTNLKQKYIRPLALSSISERVNHAFEYMTKYADLDKYGLFVSKVGKGEKMEDSKQSPSELFATVMMMVLSKQFVLSERGNNILTYMSKLHKDTGHFRFFVDLDVIPCDYDTTSLSLFLLKNSNLVSDKIIHQTIDKMFLNINEDNILMTFDDPKRPRICPIVCTNILNLVYLMKRENHPCIEATRKYIFDYLVTDKYETNFTYYPNPDLFLYTISKLVYYYPNKFHEFREPIIEKLMKRKGVKAMDDCLSLSCRLIVSSIFKIENRTDFEKLISMQKEDGSWPESLLYSTHNKTKGLFYWTNVGVSTMFGMKALELNNFNQNNTNKLNFI